MKAIYSWLLSFILSTAVVFAQELPAPNVPDLHDHIYVIGDTADHHIIGLDLESWKFDKEKQISSILEIDHFPKPIKYKNDLAILSSTHISIDCKNKKYELGESTLLGSNFKILAVNPASNVWKDIIEYADVDKKILTIAAVASIKLCPEPLFDDNPQWDTEPKEETNQSSDSI